MSLIVVEPGLQSLLVDFGRPRSRSLGMPIGGAADRWSLAVGNALVGNPPDSLALEVTLTGPTLRSDSAAAGVVFGAPFDLTSDRQSLTTGTTLTLAAGETLRIRGTPRGMRSYLCVAGGFEAPIILGSHSALAPIQAGQVLACRESRLPKRFIDPTAGAVPAIESSPILRILPGPQADWFDLSSFLAERYSIAPASDRMGLRIIGPPLVRPKREMVSEPVCPGSVQVTNDGQCIILGIDGQTIGGYPKIAQIIQADLDCLAQLRPGDTIRFASVTLDEAEAAAVERNSRLNRLLARIAAGVQDMLTGPIAKE
jgi:antagonist of KipI